MWRRWATALAGGAGLPFSAEPPNGWSVCFSACPMYDKDKQMTEFGIDPDYKVDLTSEDFHRGKDTIIEFARHLYNNKVSCFTEPSILFWVLIFLFLLKTAAENMFDFVKIILLKVIAAFLHSQSGCFTL